MSDTPTKKGDSDTFRTTISIEKKGERAKRIVKFIFKLFKMCKCTKKQPGAA